MKGLPLQKVALRFILDGKGDEDNFLIGHNFLRGKNNIPPIVAES